MSLYLHTADVAGRRSRMTYEPRYDEGLEEIWRIKREIAAQYSSFDDYFQGMLDFQEEQRRNGVKFVSHPPRRVQECCMTA